MATIHTQPDPASPSGGWLITSDNPAVLAAVPDAFVQILGLGTDAASCWALHPSEQDGFTHTAYAHEKGELGQLAQVQVVELTRPRQQNVVWVDRHHLVATAPSAGVVTRLLGLYAGSEGHLLAYVHHPSVVGTFSAIVGRAPMDYAREWNTLAIVEQARFGMLYDGRRPQELRVSCATPYRQGATQALSQLAQHVAAW